VTSIVEFDDQVQALFGRSRCIRRSIFEICVAKALMDLNALP
jgi:hypothetical protein